MLILFDQGTPLGIRNSLPGHVVRTARQQGWSTLLNGELLNAAEGFHGSLRRWLRLKADGEKAV